MNITIIDDPISYISYISQVSSTSPIADQFTVDAFRNIYVLSVYNKEPSLASTDAQLIQYRKEKSRLSYVMLTLACRPTYVLASLE